MKEDLQILGDQAYHRLEWGADLVRRYHELKPGIPTEYAAKVEHLYRWFLAPLTLWPLNLHDFLETLLGKVGSKKAPDSEMLLVLDMLPALPDEEAIAIVREHEKDVQVGRYEHLVPSSGAKFAATERAIARKKEFREDWARISAAFEISKFQDHKGVVRRTMVAERSLRGDFQLDWSHQEKRFYAVFDAFCLKWNLYGMQNGKPLVQKLSVNLTPFGTMIFIPSYWSLDQKRDLMWKPINALHRARVPRRQGKALAEGDEQRLRDATKLQSLESKARALGLRGTKRHEFLCIGLGWDPRTDPKRIARLRKVI